MEKRNGMCPICFLKQLLMPRRKVSRFVVEENYANGVALTPPMGWSSWNTFKNQISETLMLETAQAMADKGLAQAGYRYLNLDDCWHSSLRDEDGNLQGDLERFPSGIPSLIRRINDLGLQVGLYSSNGTLTCEDLPAGLGNEWKDAYTMAQWGAEFFKYDFCHNIPLSGYAPLVESITVCAYPGAENPQRIDCTRAHLEGLAKRMPDRGMPCGWHVSGLDRGLGKMTFDNVYVERDGEYVLTIGIRKKGKYDKFLMATVNGQPYFYEIPPQTIWNDTARFQQIVRLKKGVNVVELSNPVASRADSAMIQYYRMGQMLKLAAERVARERGEAVTPIVYSICEWGANRPAQWARKAGNMWRTTPDIRPWWPWIVHLYDTTVDDYASAGPGNWNDPDMLEVGNGKLSATENRAHFTLWCMMSAPLILGNDLRSMSDEVLQIVTTRALIEVDQDPLGKACKRLRKRRGGVDVLAKPMADGSAVVCFFNRAKSGKKAKLDLSVLQSDAYIGLAAQPRYDATELWTGQAVELTDTLQAQIDGHGVAVYRIRPRNA